MNAEEETHIMHLDGDDLASFCHAVAVLWDEFGYDPEKFYWDQ